MHARFREVNESMPKWYTRSLPCMCVYSLLPLNLEQILTCIMDWLDV